MFIRFNKTSFLTSDDSLKVGVVTYSLDFAAVLYFFSRWSSSSLGSILREHKHNNIAKHKVFHFSKVICDVFLCYSIECSWNIPSKGVIAVSSSISICAQTLSMGLSSGWNFGRNVGICPLLIRNFPISDFQIENQTMYTSSIYHFSFC